jgi:hypothetical protein
MIKRKFNVDKILKLAHKGPTKWELDNIVYHDRTTNPKTLVQFLTRIKELENTKSKTDEQSLELDILNSLCDDLDEKECESLLKLDEEQVQQNFIEDLARQVALETLANSKVSICLIETMCKLSPSDFILCSKRTQDLINSIKEFVIQGETLSDEVASA